MSRLTKKENWYGAWTALVTPLVESNGDLKLDTKSLEKLIDSQLDAGCLTGLVIAGSTGEGSLLDEALYRELLESAKKFVGGKVPLVAGIGIGGTLSCLRNTRIAKELGYDAVLASPPAYIKTPQRGLVEHFLAVASIGLPVCLYEVAGRAGSSLSVDTIDSLCHSAHPSSENIIAVKDASGDILRALESSQRFGEKVALLSGDDFTLQAFIASGGHGAISVATHVIPKSMKKIIDATLAGELSVAARIQYDMQPLLRGLFKDSNPIPVKSLCHKLGLISNLVFCPPLLGSKVADLNELFLIYERFKTLHEA